MKITFITTCVNYWGGCEELWTRCAKLVLKREFKIQILVYQQKDSLHPVLKDLKRLSDSFIEMENYLIKKSFTEKVFSKIYRKVFPESLSKIDKFQPDVILNSQPITYGASFHPVLYPYLLDTKIPFFLISQFNTE